VEAGRGGVRVRPDYAMGGGFDVLAAKEQSGCLIVLDQAACGTEGVAGRRTCTSDGVGFVDGGRIRSDQRAWADGGELDEQRVADGKS
jgi:hypothetical protein